ncbi:MAG: radical SAM/SPASM domain-containing protein [bacterium]|nr:radical SAM/SPASM domain-containing protein [bacterium]
MNKNEMDAYIQESSKQGDLKPFNVISIETSQYCNRRCTFCPNYYHPPGKERMESELFHKIIRQLQEIDYASTVILHQYNEPLLDERLPEFIALTRKQLPGSTILFSTNGDYLTPELWQRLYTSGLDYAIIGQYDGKVNPHIQKIYDNLDDRQKKAFRLRVSSKLTNTRGGLVNKERIPGDPLEQCCARPFFQITIRYTGEVVLCCEDFLSEVVSGNVKEEGIMEIWNGEHFRKVRRQLFENNRTFAKVCTACNTTYGESLQKCHTLAAR